MLLLLLFQFFIISVSFSALGRRVGALKSSLIVIIDPHLHANSIRPACLWVSRPCPTIPMLNPRLCLDGTFTFGNQQTVHCPIHSNLRHSSRRAPLMLVLPISGSAYLATRVIALLSAGLITATRLSPQNKSEQNRARWCGIESVLCAELVSVK